MFHRALIALSRHHRASSTRPFWAARLAQPTIHSTADRVLCRCAVDSRVQLAVATVTTLVASPVSAMRIPSHRPKPTVSARPTVSLTCPLGVSRPEGALGVSLDTCHTITYILDKNCQVCGG